MAQMTPLRLTQLFPLAALSALATPGCVPTCSQGSAEVVIYDEDFEQLCDGAPCSWRLSRGELGSVETVTTIHAGETAVKLIGEAITIESDGYANRGPNGSLSFPLVVRLSARCDEGSYVTARVITETPDTREEASYTAAVTPPSEWGAATTTMLMRDDRRGESFEALGRRVIKALIEKHGEGACEIDRFEVADMSYSGGFCD